MRTAFTGGLCNAATAGLTHEKEDIWMNRFKDYITRELFYAGMSPEEYNLTRNDIQEENRKSLLTFSAITVVFLLIMFVISFVSEDVEVNRWVYLAVMIVTAAMFAVAYLNRHVNHTVLYLNIYLL